MKTSKTLHESIGFQNPAQKAYYAANILIGALTSSPTIEVRKAIKAVPGKRAIPAYTGFVATSALTATQNTTGFATGERFPGRPAVAAIPASNGYAAVAAISALAPSPAFAIGVAVPAYPAVPARAEQIEVLPVLAVTGITTPKIVAVPGWEDAIEITKSETQITVVAELPVYAGAKLAGSALEVIGEITPTALQATAFLDDVLVSGGINDGGGFINNYPLPDPADETTLEQFFYRNLLLCEHVIADSVRNGIRCKTISATLYPDLGFDPESDLMQLAEIMTAPV